MKKIIIPGLIIIFATICYVIGYVWATSDINTPNVKERVYFMQEATTPTKDVEAVAKEELTYILYPLYGEVLIYQSEGVSMTIQASGFVIYQKRTRLKFSTEKECLPEKNYITIWNH